jgi:hypothetical protein
MIYTQRKGRRQSCSAATNARSPIDVVRRRRLFVASSVMMGWIGERN